MYITVSAQHSQTVLFGTIFGVLNKWPHDDTKKSIFSLFSLFSTATLLKLFILKYHCLKASGRSDVGGDAV